MSKHASYRRFASKDRRRSPLLYLLMIMGMIAGSPTALLAQQATSSFKLQNENVEVSLRSDIPAITEYKLNNGNKILLGDVKGTGPGISFYKGGDQVVSNWTTMRYSANASQDGRTVTYHASVAYQGQPAIEFELVYALTNSGLDISYKNVVEHEGFYLIYILLPELITVEGNAGVSQLAIPADAGRLIDVKATRPHELEYEIDWLHPILAGMAYNADAIGIMDTKSIENHSIASVFDYGGKRYGSFSMKLMHRLMEYDLHEFGPVVPVTDPAQLLKVQDGSALSIEVRGDYDRDGRVSWIDGTKVLREQIKAVPSPKYKDKSFVRTFVDRPPTRRDTTGRREELKFSEVLQRIKEFAAQTDSAAYEMYLLGWQYEGHDSGYPSVDKVNENLGGYEALVNLIKEAKTYNVNVSFYDNYDDSYPTHPGWDPDVICLDPQGQMIKGGVWEGSQSYLISTHKYVMKNALDRVRFTLDRYPVSGSYFIDVLSGGYNGGRKYDFDPKNPAGAIKNFDAKLRIIKAFNDGGIDIATEDFAGYFVGHVATFGNIIAFDNVYFENEQAIPLIPFIYHSKTSYGMKISDRSKNLTRFIYGHRAEKFTNKRSVFTPADYILDNLPKQKIYGKAMRSYQKNGNVERVVYEDGSVIEVDVTADKYSVALEDGFVIAKDYVSFVPVSSHEILACSRDGGAINHALPRGWNTKKMSVWKLNADGTRDRVKFKTSGGKITFQSVANAPYKVMTASSGS